MYRLKTGVNLKLLEQFGYHKSIDDSCHKCYRKDLEYLDYIAIYENGTVFIDVEDFSGNSWEKYQEELLSDLIKADLVEKIGE